MSCVVVFGREAVPGRVKTRLAARLGADPAAELYRTLLEHTLAAAAGCGERTVLALADPPGPGFAAPPGVAVEEQPAGDLGERMAGSFSRRFAEGHRRVVLIGSDCPAVGPERLRRAFAALDRARVVLGPADDGGYWLVGQRAPGLDLFSGVPWSSPGTYSATLERLAGIGVRAERLERLADLDTLEDLAAAIADPRVDQGVREALSRFARRSPGGGC